MLSFYGIRSGIVCKLHTRPVAKSKRVLLNSLICAQRLNRFSTSLTQNTSHVHSNSTEKAQIRTATAATEGKVTDVLHTGAKIDKEWTSYYWDTIPPTLEQLSYADRYFISSTPKFLYQTHRFFQLPESDAPEVAFLGRSNSGKSSLLNALFNYSNHKIAKVSKKPGRTRAMTAFGIGGNREVSRSSSSLEKQPLRLSGRGGLVVMDMPGYGFGSHEEWGKEILKYLQRRKQWVNRNHQVPCRLLMVY